ncbi:hypothetical protein Q75_01420 [Bacillus coahuilensis p1.1.43]|uniref:HTH tetR-type domain-containing protein n=1 Tax=Bacillus coahuilensis p1.1.43 TaxID=1150625 RepID=A0A147KC25_9BACI|nr:TetR/AcrR family transcriptional regulator [Bacillus coahuilensis]KUP09125.1 hypothetical protein Q75_01420 [Bacillus coahuilensis p1.1.43]
MTEKEFLIMETAMKLFAQKGYSSTSIQDITRESGISKGAFYLHFETKEALLLQTFHYYFGKIKENTDHIMQLPLSPRDKLAKQMEVQLEDVLRHKEFIIMQFRERAIPFSNGIEEFLHQMKRASFRFYQMSLLEIYGEKIRPYTLDISFLLSGIFEHILGMLIFEKIPLDQRRVPQFLLRRLDDIVDGYIRAEEAPLLNPELFSELTKESKCFQDNVIEQTMREITFLLESEKNPLLQDTLLLIKEELQSSSPRIALLKGMRANIEGISPYKQLQKQLDSLMTIGLE